MSEMSDSFFLASRKDPIPDIGLFLRALIGRPTLYYSLDGTKCSAER